MAEYKLNIIFIYYQLLLFCIALGTMFPKSVDINADYVGMVTCSDPPPRNSFAKVLS